jgi:cysteine desulfurase family protein (TIGR01976 family)
MRSERLPHAEAGVRGPKSEEPGRAHLASPVTRPDAVASVEDIRSRFPALERVHNGYPVAYFDGPGGTQVPRHVVDAMRDYLFHHNANTHWEYPSSAETDRAIEWARESVADFVHGDPTEVSFGNNMTTITFHVARALARSWKAGDEVIVTNLDHQANVSPWRALAREHGIVIRTVPFHSATGELDWPALERAFSARTRLLAIGAASNALGTITDVSAATRLAHAARALVFVDAVHYAAHGTMDARAIDCDFLACSSYKFYGPHAGLLYGKSDVLRSMDVPKVDPAPDTVPDRLETGTQNHEGIVGTGAAVDFLASLASTAAARSRRENLTSVMQTLHARGTALVGRMWSGLRAIAGVTCYGPPPDRPRTPTISFVVDGVPSATVARRLAERGVFASHGDFYASTVIEQLGHQRDGVVRAGCACYTTEDEVDRLLDGVEFIAQRS